MSTLYYPHFDLQNKGLLKTPPNHVLNIKLLTLMTDKVLIRTSHLLNTQLKYLYMIENELSDFIIAGKVETAVYSIHGTLEDYFDNKIEETADVNLRRDYKIKGEYIKKQIFNEHPQLINMRMNCKGTYLNLSEVDLMIDEFIKKENDIQRKIEKVKRIVFGLSLGAIVDTIFSSIVGLFLVGHLAAAIALVLSVVTAESKIMQRVQRITTDNIIENILASKEPFYVITSKISSIADNMENNK